MTQLTGSEARTFWKALMDNASALIQDAHVLLNSGSYGRARSLKVLAQEELGKAIWIYDAFQGSWSRGDDHPLLVETLGKFGRSHIKKYLEAFVFSDELAAFWGDYSHLDSYNRDTSEEDWKQRQRAAEAAAVEANIAKQQGFYVDRDAQGIITSPTDIETGTIAEDLQTAAQVIEMLLIKDHSRMKFDAQTPYDDTHAQQFRLLPISHPDDWAAASEIFRSSATSHRSKDDDPTGARTSE
jgi:AbiV family abortive infection protein